MANIPLDEHFKALEAVSKVSLRTIDYHERRYQRLRALVDYALTKPTAEETVAFIKGELANG